MDRNLQAAAGPPFPVRPPGTRADRREARGTKRCCALALQRMAVGSAAGRAARLLRLSGSLSASWLSKTCRVLLTAVGTSSRFGAYGP